VNKYLGVAGVISCEVGQAVEWLPAQIQNSNYLPPSVPQTYREFVGRPPRDYDYLCLSRNLEQVLIIIRANWIIDLCEIGNILRSITEQISDSRSPNTKRSAHVLNH